MNLEAPIINDNNVGQCDLKDIKYDLDREWLSRSETDYEGCSS